MARTYPKWLFLTCRGIQKLSALGNKDRGKEIPLSVNKQDWLNSERSFGYPPPLFLFSIKKPQ